MTDRGMIVIGLMAVIGTIHFAPVPEAVQTIGFFVAFGTVVALLVTAGDDG